LPSVGQSIVDIPEPPAELALIDQKLREIEDEAATLTREMKEDEAENRRRLMDMVVALDEQSNQTQEEITRIQSDGALRETQHRSDLKRIVEEIAQVRVERARAEEQRRARVAIVQADITKIEDEFKAKMADAARVAARLRAALENAKLRKGQQLANERERAAERGKLLQENSALKIRISKLENDVRIARGNVTALKKHVTVAIGPRRAASLLI
jgi:chromosome segregation ATPase